MTMRYRLIAIAALFICGVTSAADAPAIRVSIDVDPAIAKQPLTGRMFLMVSRKEGVEPRLLTSYTYAYYFNDPSVPFAPFFAADVENFAPGKPVAIDASAAGFPVASLKDLPAGDYFVQAVLNVYQKLQRADGHVVWVHPDRGEGQQFHIAPGNLVSEPVKLHLDPSKGVDAKLTLSRVLPAIPQPADTAQVKRVSFTSERISKFWGTDMRFGAIVVLPKDYDKHPDVKYPVVIHQGHWMEGLPLAFPDGELKEPPAGSPAAVRKHYEGRKAFRDAWYSDSFPRMILVSLQHPTPYYDDSYLVNSANNGPWADALLQEMLPFLEKKFRMIGKPYARVMTGGSTGGWITAALQIRYPESFGGAWSFCPDPIDFREFVNVDIYKDAEAFTVPGYEWLPLERPVSRTVKGQPRLSVRQLSQLSAALGTRGRSAEFLDMWSAVDGPVGADGYPRLIWDHATGKIDKEVAEYWRANDYDLREYLERNWSTVGPKLGDNLHFSCGDMDNFYLNLAMYKMEDFLTKATNPKWQGSFKYGRPMIGHEFYGYDPWPMTVLEEMAGHIERHAPAEDQPTRWRYR